MRPDKFTSKLQEALSDAQSLAVGLDHNYIEPIHILSTLLEQQGCLPLLVQAGANAATLKAQVEQAIEQLPKVQNPDGELRFFTGRCTCLQ